MIGEPKFPRPDAISEEPEIRERVPELYPVDELPKDDDQGYYRYGLDNIPPLHDGRVLHFIRTIQWGNKKEVRDCFMAQEHIAGHTYLLYLAQNSFHEWSLIFKTREYGYARTSLSPEDTETLFTDITRLLEASHSYMNGQIRKIEISPASHSHTAQEYEACLNKILTSENNTLSAEEIREEYPESKIFDYYQGVFDTPFQKQHHGRGGKARARSRYFKALFTKYCPNWLIHSLDGSLDFYLVRKDNQ